MTFIIQSLICIVCSAYTGYIIGQIVHSKSREKEELRLAKEWRELAVMLDDILAIQKDTKELMDSNKKIAAMWKRPADFVKERMN